MAASILVKWTCCVVYFSEMWHRSVSHYGTPRYKTVCVCARVVSIAERKTRAQVSISINVETIIHAIIAATPRICEISLFNSNRLFRRHLTSADCRSHKHWKVLSNDAHTHYTAVPIPETRIQRKYYELNDKIPPEKQYCVKFVRK